MASLTSQNTIRETVRYWSDLKIDDQALQTRLGDKVELVFEYRRLQEDLRRAESNLTQRLVSGITDVFLEPIRIDLQKRVTELQEKLEDPSQQSPENKQALEAAKAGLQELVGEMASKASRMLKDLQPLKDQVEAAGSVQIDGQIPAQKGFFQAWIAPTLTYLPKNPFAKRTKEASEEQKRIAEQEAEIAKLRGELAKEKELNESKHPEVSSETVNKELAEAVRGIFAAPGAEIAREQAEPQHRYKGRWEIVTLASFKFKPITQETAQEIERFEKAASAVSEVTDNYVKERITLANKMGLSILKDIAALQSQYPELKEQTPAEIFKNKDCYLSYFLQKAKNNLSCWPVEQEYMGLSDDVIEYSKRVDEQLTLKAQSRDIILTLDSTLPSMIWNEAAETTGHSFEDGK